MIDSGTPSRRPLTPQPIPATGFRSKLPHSRFSHPITDNKLGTCGGGTVILDGRSINPTSKEEVNDHDRPNCEISKGNST